MYIIIYTLELDNSIENRAKTNIAIIIFWYHYIVFNYRWIMYNKINIISNIIIAITIIEESIHYKIN